MQSQVKRALELLLDSVLPPPPFTIIHPPPSSSLLPPPFSLSLLIPPPPSFLLPFSLLASREHVVLQPTRKSIGTVSEERYVPPFPHAGERFTPPLSETLLRNHIQAFYGERHHHPKSEQRHWGHLHQSVVELPSSSQVALNAQLCMTESPTHAASE